MTTTTATAPAFTEPDEYGTPPMIDAPAPVEQPPADDKPRRPTTRSGRAAAKAAKVARTASSDTKPKTSTPRKASLETRLTGAMVTMGGTIMAGAALAGSQPLQQDGLVIIEHSATMAAAISKVADQDPRVKAALEKMLTAGVWSGVAVATLPVALGIAGNHGLIPPGLAALLLGQAKQPAESAAA